MTATGERPLRVVRIIARLNVGGPARHVAILDAGLRDRGYTTLLLHGQPDRDEGSLDRLVRERGLPVASVPALGRAVRPWRDLRAFCAIARTIFATRPHVVHTHTTKAGVLGRLAALLYNATRRRSRRCLVVHTYHGTVFHGYFGHVGDLLVRIVERLLAAGTDRVVVLSERQRREIVEGLRIAPAGRVAIVPLGLELDPLLRMAGDAPTLHLELGLPDNAFVLGFVGRLVDIKDPATLLRAFERVTDRVPHAMLLLAGDGPLRPGLDALAASLKISNSVRFLGWRHDLAALYATLDVVVLSSRNEGTPVSVIEAMAAGRAVVATDVGGVGDVIDHEETGVLVPAARPDALAEAIQRLATDEAARRRLGSSARRSVAARFSAVRLVDDVDRRYRDDLAAKRRGAALAR